MYGGGSETEPAERNSQIDRWRVLLASPTLPYGTPFGDLTQQAVNGIRSLPKTLASGSMPLQARVYNGLDRGLTQRGRPVL